MIVFFFFLYNKRGWWQVVTMFAIELPKLLIWAVFYSGLMEGLGFVAASRMLSGCVNHRAHFLSIPLKRTQSDKEEKKDVPLVPEFFFGAFVSSLD